MGLARWQWIGLCALAASPIWGQIGVNPDADRVVLGAMTQANWVALQNLPLPSQPNQKFCGLIPLTSNLWAYVYVPTAAERKGDFSSFPGAVIDPLTGQPFPSNLIPVSRVPGVVAMRISAVPPTPAANCAAGTDLPVYLALNYVTGYGQSDQIALGTNFLTINYRTGDFQVPQSVSVFSGGPNALYWAVVEQFPLNVPNSFTPTEPWLANTPKRGLTPSSVSVSVKPGSMLPGAYTSGFLVVPVAVISPPKVVTVQLNLSVPTSYIQVERPDPAVTFTIGDTDPPPPTTFQIKTLGAAQSFTADIVFVSPPASAGIKWLSVSPAAGNAPASLKVSFDPVQLAKLHKGSFLAFVRVTAPGAPNSPQFVPFLLAVFPTPPEITVTSDSDPIVFDFTPGSVAEQKRIRIDPVQAVVGDAFKDATFSVTASTEDGHDWLTVDANTFTGVPKSDLHVSLNPTVLAGLKADQYRGWVSIGTANVTSGEIAVRLTLGELNRTEVVTTRVIAQVVDGANWKTFITLMNTDQTKERPFTLIFHRGRRAVAPSLEFESLGVLSPLQIEKSIPAGGSLTLATAGTSSQLWEGWAELRAVDAVDGTAMFRVTQSAEQDSEGAVPIKAVEGTRFLLPFDNSQTPSGRYDTGFAILNSSDSSSTNVQVTVRDESGAVVGRAATPISLGPSEHMAFSLPAQVSATAGIRGVVEFSSDGNQIAGLGLRFSPRGNFTSFETISSGSTATQRLTHIADGSGWKTTIVLVNPDPVNPISVSIGFKAGLNTPPSRSLPLVGRSYTAGNTFSLIVPSGTSVTLESQGNPSDPLWMGWAEINPSGPLGGFAVFRGDRSGIESEGAVPMLSGTSAKFYMPFDNTGGVVTSVAMVNSGANVNMVFRGESGSPAATSSLPLQGHTAFELTQPQFQIGGMRGVAEFNSDGTDLLGLGLRFNDSRRAFTSLPVVRK